MSPRGAHQSGGVASDPVAHSLVQVAVDIFEDLVILFGEAAQNVLHRLEALLPVVDLWDGGAEGGDRG